MTYQETFPVSNKVVDRYFATLTGAEVKILIVVFRQTLGWVDTRTGKRKTRDWISHSQFVSKTGLSRRAISLAVQSLVAKGLIVATNQQGKPLACVENRRGQSKIYYSPNMSSFCSEPVQFLPKTCAEDAHNKTNYTKRNNTKERSRAMRANQVMSIGDILNRFGYKS